MLFLCVCGAQYDTENQDQKFHSSIASNHDVGRSMIADLKHSAFVLVLDAPYVWHEPCHFLFQPPIVRANCDESTVGQIPLIKNSINASYLSGHFPFFPETECLPLLMKNSINATYLSGPFLFFPRNRMPASIDQ
jgi:hypothetical protein